MGDVKAVDRCPACRKGNMYNCKVIGGKGYIVTIKCGCCGFTWQTMD